MTNDASLVSVDPANAHRASRRLWGLALVASVVALSAWLAVSLWGRRGADYLRGLEEITQREEGAAQAALAARLAVLESRDRAKLVEAAVSAPLLGRIFQELDGVEFAFRPRPAARDEIKVRLEKPVMEFRDGFPRLSAGGRASFHGVEVRVAARVVVQPELRPAEVGLKLRCLGLAPEGERLPGWAADLAMATATKAANDALDKYPIVLPFQTKVEVPFTKPERIELPVRTENGQVFVGIDLPQPPTVRRWVQPREVFFSREALHVLIEPLTSSPPPLVVPAPSAASSPVTAEELKRRLAPWRLAPDLGYSVRIGREFLTGLLTEVNAWKPEERTVRMQGLRQEGHLLDRTGGAPFGNGFGAWLDGPERLHGEVEVRNFQPGWEPPRNQIPLTLQAAAGGGGQIHVHGNAPHIDPPTIFGVRIGGGATIGGGAGTSVGITLRQDGVPTLSAVAQLTPATGHFEVRLLEPGDLLFKVEAGGIPSALLDFFHVGLKVPLPRDRPLFTFDVPALLKDAVQVPLPAKNGQPQTLSLHSEEFRASMDSDGLSITGKVTVGTATPP